MRRRIGGIFLYGMLIWGLWRHPGYAATENLCAAGRMDLQAVQMQFDAVHLLQMAVNRPERLGTAIAPALARIAAHESALQRLYTAEQQAFAALAPAFGNPDRVWQDLKAAFTAQFASLPCDAETADHTTLADRLLLQLEQASARYPRKTAAPETLPEFISTAPFVAWVEAALDASSLSVERALAERTLKIWLGELGTAAIILQRTGQTPAFKTAAHQAKTCWPQGVRIPATAEAAFRSESFRKLKTLSARPVPFPAILLERELACSGGLRDSRPLAPRNIRQFLETNAATTRPAHPTAALQRPLVAQLVWSDLIRARNVENARSVAGSPLIAAPTKQQILTQSTRQHQYETAIFGQFATATTRLHPPVAEHTKGMADLTALITATGLLQQQRQQVTDAALQARLMNLGQTWGQTLIQPPLIPALRVTGATTPSLLEGLVAFSTLHGDTADRIVKDLGTQRLPLWQPWVEGVSCTATTRVYQHLQNIPPQCLPPTERQMRTRLLQQLQEWR